MEIKELDEILNTISFLLLSDLVCPEKTLSTWPAGIIFFFSQFPVGYGECVCIAILLKCA